MNRRSLLLGLGAMMVAQGLAGCSRQSTAPLNIQFLKTSLPTPLLRDFQREIDAASLVEFVPVDRLADLFDHLTEWQGQTDANTADWLTLGDYWLAPAIRQNLIEPLDLESLSGWSKIPPQWQTLVRRDRQGLLDPNGPTWAAPYRWGSLVIVYPIEVFENLGWQPTDWEDLWHPDLKGQISLLDSPRTVIGLTLKRLGRSINTEAPRQVPGLTEALKTLQEQVKVYSSTAYLQPLLLGDTLAAVGWSTDVLPLLRRDRRYAAVIPESGTVLTADLWVRPRHSNTAGQAGASAAGGGLTGALADLPLRWIEYCWQPNPAQRLTLQSYAASPVLLTGDRSQLPLSLQQDSLLLPPDDQLERSEFLAPLDRMAIAAYEKLWTAMRLGNL